MKVSDKRKQAGVSTPLPVRRVFWRKLIIS
jgi:hypothetical protein